MHGAELYIHIYSGQMGKTHQSDVYVIYVKCWCPNAHILKLYLSDNIKTWKRSLFYLPFSRVAL